MVDSANRPSFRERARRLREAEILAAARELMGQRDYHTVSMDDVAERVGISKATLYQHVPSKEELVLRVIGREMDTFIEYLAVARAGDDSPAARLEGVLRRLVELRYGASGSELGIEDNQVVKLFKSQPEFSARQERIKALTRDLIDQAKAAGEIRLELPTGIIAASFFAMLITPHYEGFVHHGGTVEQLADFLRAIFFDGIRRASAE